MTYWRYWQLNAAPFANAAPQELFLGATVEEAVARVEFLISNRRRVGALLGPCGVGKSALIAYCANNPPLTVEVPSVQAIRTSMLGLGAGDLLNEMAIRLTGNRFPACPVVAWNAICDYFQAASREGTQTVLFVDDTETSTVAAESDLSRLLSKSFPLTIVFAVETQMASAVSGSLFAHTDLQIDLPPWDQQQCVEFLAWTTRRLGRSEAIFTVNAIEQMYLLSDGIPRKLIQLADLSLVAGAVCRADCVDRDCVQQVAHELPRSSAA